MARHLALLDEHIEFPDVVAVRDRIVPRKVVKVSVAASIAAAPGVFW